MPPCAAVRPTTSTARGFAVFFLYSVPLYRLCSRQLIPRPFLLRLPSPIPFYVLGSNIFYIFCLVLFVYLTYKTTTFERELLYDPFDILGIDKVGYGCATASPGGGGRLVFMRPSYSFTRRDGTLQPLATPFCMPPSPPSHTPWPPPFAVLVFPASFLDGPANCPWYARITPHIHTHIYLSAVLALTPTDRPLGCVRQANQEGLPRT